ncbi:MAG: glutamine-hydrolyzing GMP synthase [Candidatus Hydrogenedentota bacterium]
MIAILDFGSQYTQLIARAIRQQGVYSVILPHTTTRAQLMEMKASGVVLSGGPASVNDENAPGCDPELLSGELPLLGICYGMQLLCRNLGGVVTSGDRREYGRALVSLMSPGGGFSTNGCSSKIFQGMAATQKVWMSHGDRCVKLPDGFRGIALSHGTASAESEDQACQDPSCLQESGDSICVAIQDEKMRRFGVQFHPEVAHTENGQTLLANFLFHVCGCERDWTTETFVEESIREIRETVGNDKVVLGVSGGVDSSVASVLIHRAIGDRLVPVFIDNGLLRQNEREEVAERFKRDVGVPLHVHDASVRFLSALAGVTDPEEKRKIIGKTFIDSFTETLRSIGAGSDDAIKFLAQGTLYPDLIESRSAMGGPSAKIKTHHNVGGLPADLKFKLLEPLKWLFKDDVRRVGRELGLPHDTLGRHPFPGPGLAVRVLGEITAERLRILRAADHIFISELRAAKLYDHTSQAFAVLLPVKSVGVMGDARTYEEVVAIRAVTTLDFMTADWADLPGELLRTVSNRIINEVAGINRVVYDISSKPPATIEWE